MQTTYPPTMDNVIEPGAPLRCQHISLTLIRPDPNMDFHSPRIEAHR